MNAPLLRTKLCVPPIRPALVPRPRLVERLNGGRHGRLTLISAPAGFGKTTLLSEWVSDLGCAMPDFGPTRVDTPIQNPKPKIQNQVAWLSLDEGDNDLARFLTYLFAALRTIPSLDQADVGSSALAVLQSSGLTSVGVHFSESLLTDLINDIAAAGPDPFLLILDDYHEIRAASIHNALTFLLDHQPPQMHLVIATRADPPLPMARLRGRGQLTELRLHDLRFTPEEAAGFLNQVMGLGLAAGDIAALVSRTEGWIAGLQMAAVSMQGREDVAAFVQAFAGSNRYILDYLVEEVLQRQPEDVQAFLLQTAVLNRLTGPLCDAVLCRRADGQGGKGDLVPTAPLVSVALACGHEVLEYLERANLFVVPLDDRREWYRYHRLFADLLRKRLYQTQPDRVPILHRRASGWYECNGLMAPAIDHALAADDFARAADLIERVAEATLMRSEVATLLRWVEALPDELVRARPALCVSHAYALLLDGRSLDKIEARLRDAGEGSEPVSGQVAALRALAAIFQGQLSRAVELSHQALERLPESDAFLRSVAAWILSLSCLTNGDFRAGSQALDEVARASQDMGNVMVAVAAMCNLAKLRSRRGQLYEAKAIYERALALAIDRQGQPLPIASEPLLGLGELCREWNDLEAATRYLVEGIELTRRWSEAAALDAYLPLALVRQAQGDVDGARDAIEKAWRLALKSETTELDDRAVALQQARLSVVQGDLEAAWRWVEKRGLALSAFSGYGQRQADRLKGDVSLVELPEADDFLSYRFRKYEHLVLTRLLVAQDRPGEALALLESLLAMAVKQGRNDLLIEIQVLRALAFQKQGDIALAMAALERALSLAEPGGYVRIFVDEGPPMARLLYEAAAHGIAPEYVSRLLAAWDEETKDQGRRAKERDSSHDRGPLSVLIEPLSERELEVLNLIAEGLSNREIAGRLFISLSTVKGHASSIYGKLAVNSRTQAVTKAGVLGILPNL